MDVLTHWIQARRSRAGERRLAPDLLEEEVELGVRVGVLSDFEQRAKNVVQHLLKVLHDALLPVQAVQPRDLQGSEEKSVIALAHAFSVAAKGVEHMVAQLHQNGRLLGSWCGA